MALMASGGGPIQMVQTEPALQSAFRRGTWIMASPLCSGLDQCVHIGGVPNCWRANSHGDVCQLHWGVYVRIAVATMLVRPSLAKSE